MCWQQHFFRRALPPSTLLLIGRARQAMEGAGGVTFEEANIGRPESPFTVDGGLSIKATDRQQYHTHTHTHRNTCPLYSLVSTNTTAAPTPHIGPVFV